MCKSRVNSKKASMNSSRETWATWKRPVDFQVPGAFLGTLTPELKAGYLVPPLVSLSLGNLTF